MDEQRIRERRRSPETAGASATLASSVYDRLRRDIVMGRLQPGDRLRLGALRERYAVGHTPLREALNRLVADRLVTQIDQKGFRVATASAADLLDLTRTRCWVEERALRESIRLGDERWEEAVVVAYHHLSRTPRTDTDDFQAANPEWERRHREFHRALIGACGAERLIAFCQQLHDEAARYRTVAQAFSYPNRLSSDEHRAILHAALERDAERAVALLLEHYRRTARIVRESIAAPPEGASDRAVT